MGLEIKAFAQNEVVIFKNQRWNVENNAMSEGGRILILLEARGMMHVEVKLEGFFN